MVRVSFLKGGLGKWIIEMVRPSGLEPPTPTMSRWCSNQLSYGRIDDVSMGWSIMIFGLISNLFYFRKYN